MLSGSGGLGKGVWQFCFGSHAGNTKYLQLGLLGRASQLQSQALGGGGWKGYQTSSFLPSHWLLPFPSSEAPEDAWLLLGLPVPGLSLTGLRALGLRGERVGGQAGLILLEDPGLGLTGGSQGLLTPTLRERKVADVTPAL